MDNQTSTTALVDLLGPKLIASSQGKGDAAVEISVADLARTKKTIVLYFSAHWCPPCRGFTPLLSEAYADYKKSISSSNNNSSTNTKEDGREEEEDDDDDDDGFELIFVSSDENAESFEEYHSETMSFPALPYEARDVKASLGEKFEVRGIPHLVAVDAATGEASPVNDAVGGDLRSFVTQHGAAAFPLTVSHVARMKDEADKKAAEALEKLAAFPILVSEPSSDENGNASEEKTAVVKFAELLDQYEYIGLVFGDGDEKDATYNSLQDAAKALNNDNSKKFLPIYVGWTEYGSDSVGWTEYGDDSDHSALWARFHSIRRAELTDDVRAALVEVAGGESVTDDLAMITLRSRGSGLCGMDGTCEPSGVPVVASVDVGLRALRRFGPEAFPWNEEAVKNALEFKERRVDSLRERLAGFDFLRVQSTENENSSSLLIKGISDKEEGAEDAKYVSVDDLLATKEGDDEDDAAVLGLYFSAHWCPPCRAFTPELLKVYEEVRAKKGASGFEVVFVSFDHDEGDFKEYYSSMVTPGSKEQWLSLDYGKSRDFVNDLTEVFGVEGFPSLVLLKRDGTILSDNAGRSVSQYGAGCFPWDAESITQWDETLLKTEEEDVESQRKQGDGIVVRRMIGPVGSVKYDPTDRVLDFKEGSFSTAVLDETVVTEGVLYYEVELLAVEGSRPPIAQFGFAVQDAFEKINDEPGYGVGDNDKSWGVCGFREELWHDAESDSINDPSSTCGWKIGDVIGFAVNVDVGKIAISKNGNWAKEVGCGVVFEKVSLGEASDGGGGGGGGIHPGLSCGGLKVRLNAQEKDFSFSKPSEEVWQSSSAASSENDSTD